MKKFKFYCQNSKIKKKIKIEFEKLEHKRRKMLKLKVWMGLKINCLKEKEERLNYDCNSGQGQDSIKYFEFKIKTQLLTQI